MVFTIIINLHGGLHKGWLHWSPSQPLLHSQDEELGLRNYDVRSFRPQGDDDDDAQLRCEGFREMMMMILVLMVMKRGIKTAYVDENDTCSCHGLWESSCTPPSSLTSGTENIFIKNASLL